jgi:hypothetical protein
MTSTHSQAGRCYVTAVRATRAVLWFLLVAMALALAMTGGAQAAVEPAEAARPPVKVAVLVSSRTDLCFDTGNVGAIRRFVTLEQELINRRGGIGGRKLEIDILDDGNDPERATANLSKALSDRSMLAIVGLTNSQNATFAFKELGPAIDRSGIPFLSDIAIAEVFAKHKTVYSTRPSIEEERLAVAVEFIRNQGFKRVAFVGFKDRKFSTAFAEGLEGKLGASKMVGKAWLSWRDAGKPLDKAELAAVVPALEAADPDLIVFAMGNDHSAEAMALIGKSRAAAPVLMFGRIAELPSGVADTYPADLFQLALDGLPEVFNDRMRRKLASEAPGSWIFEGRKIASAPGWANGQCKERPPVDEPDPLEPRNLRAIAFGTQYADMLALIAAAAVSENPRGDLASMRASIVLELSTTFASGRGAYKGSFETWSFDRFSRAATRIPQVLIRPKGLGRIQLAPVQYSRLKTGALKPIPTLYADIDLIRTFNVDDSEKTFFAEFYLAMRVGEAAKIEEIEFVNAYLDPRTNGRQIAITPLHDGGPSGAYPDGMRIYKITGKFMFEPNLENFPFDSQRFAIEIQPKRADAPFIVQPPPLSMRDKAVATDGWTVRGQYAGYDTNFVPVVDAFTHEPGIVPFYTASYVWQMDRQTTDYYLRVVVPLFFILIVAYLSIFIPQSHFEAIVTIQVTALLSAVALYLSLPKLGTDSATVSDRIFVFTYMMVSLMIAISILRVNKDVSARKWLRRAFGAIHITALPLLVLGMAWYVDGLSKLGK